MALAILDDAGLFQSLQYFIDVDAFIPENYPFRSGLADVPAGMM